MHRAGAAGVGSGAMRGGRGWGEAVTLGEEVCLVLAASHSKDPSDLVWVGRVEEEGLPGTLGAKSGVCTYPEPQPCVGPWLCSGSLPTQEPQGRHPLDAARQRVCLAPGASGAPHTHSGGGQVGGARGGWGEQGS